MNTAYQVLALKSGTSGLSYSGRSKEHREYKHVDRSHLNPVEEKKPVLPVWAVKTKKTKATKPQQQRKNKMELSKLSKQELIKILEQQNAASESGLMVKENSSKGIYIRSTKFQEYSTAKDKFYVAGINIPRNTAKVLFNDPQLIEMIKNEVNRIVQ